MNKKYVIFDLDGTLALIDHRRHLVMGKNKEWDKFYLACDNDKPNKVVITMANILRSKGFAIVIFSGRGEIAKEKTIKWISDNDIPCDELMMRPIRNNTPDQILKKQWLSKYNKNDIFCIFDDRQKVVNMWRKEGFTCFQVADGNF